MFRIDPDILCDNKQLDLAKIFRYHDRLILIKKLNYYAIEMLVLILILILSKAHNNLIYLLTFVTYTT